MDIEILKKLKENKKCHGEIINNLISMETKKMRIINNASLLTLYSLSKDMENNLAELNELDKKIIWVTNSIIKVNDQVLVSKLEKKKEELEFQKRNLNILIKKIEGVVGSVKDFTLFFIFIRRFQKLAIEKLNFENDSKTISSKLIFKLQKEEESLYDSYVTGDCFSKILKSLSFEVYQCYFQEFAKKFFDNIQVFSDPYVNSLLILKATVYECSYFCTHKLGEFNLTETKFFLSRNIPHHIALPNANYELVALRCFFYYEITKEYLKLRSVKYYLGNLRKSVNLELSILNYNAYNKEFFLVGLYGLQEALNKVEEKYNTFMNTKLEDNESSASKSLGLFKKLVNEIQLINTKTENLINDKYASLTKMRHLLVIISNESHLPKFLEKFYIKIGNDFLLNEMKKIEKVETNKNALSYLFHAICKDEFYTPLDSTTKLFIEKMTEDYSIDDISVLETIELEDLIEFSFFYNFISLYTAFNSHLNSTNIKLVYTKMIVLNRYINIKLEYLEALEKRKNENIPKFFEKIFKNKEEYSKCKKNILDEIKLHLEGIQDINHILSDIKTLKASLIPSLESNSMPVPEEYLLLALSQKLEKKQKICDSEYLKIEKHQFIDKLQSEKITKNKGTNLEIENPMITNKLGFFSESLSCLAKNLAEILKHIGEDTLVIDKYREKISFAMDQLLSGVSSCNETHNIANLSLPELLKLVDTEVLKNSIIKGKKYKKRLLRLQELFNNIYLSIECLIDQVNIVINKFHSSNKDVKKTLSILFNYFSEDYNTHQFFSKSMVNKLKKNMRLLNDYIKLKKQSNWLTELIQLIKLGADPRVVNLYAIIVESDDYQETYKFFSEKINFAKINPNKKLYKSKKAASVVKQKNSDDLDKKIALSSSSPIADIEIPIRSLNGIEAESNVISIEKQLDFNDDLIRNQEPLNVEEGLMETNIPHEPSLKNLSTHSDSVDKILLQDYEIWNLAFEKWKNDKQVQLYKLFHIIENCSKTVLINTGNAFLKYLSLHRTDLIEKKDELKMHKTQIISFFNDLAKKDLFMNYLTQYLNWFEEIFQRINICETLILQNEQNSEIQVSPRLPSPIANNRAEFNSLLIFYLEATDKYNKSRDNLVYEENKLNNLNRNFIKQILDLGSLNEMDEDNLLSDFNSQLVKVSQLKLTIEQEFETKQKIKERLSFLASPEIVKFYLSRIDPYDADSLNSTEKNLLPLQLQSASTASYVMPTSLQEYSIAPTFYYLSTPTVYSADVVQSNNQIVYKL